MILFLETHFCGRYRIYTLNCHSNLNNNILNISSKLSDSPTPKSYLRMEKSCWAEKYCSTETFLRNLKKNCTYELPLKRNLTVSPESITPHKVNVGNLKKFKIYFYFERPLKLISYF